MSWMGKNHEEKKGKKKKKKRASIYTCLYLYIYKSRNEHMEWRKSSMEWGSVGSSLNPQGSLKLIKNSLFTLKVV